MPSPLRAMRRPRRPPGSSGGSKGKGSCVRPLDGALVLGVSVSLGLVYLAFFCLSRHVLSQDGTAPHDLHHPKSLLQSAPKVAAVAAQPPPPQAAAAQPPSPPQAEAALTPPAAAPQEKQAPKPAAAKGPPAPDKKSGAPKPPQQHQPKDQPPPPPAEQQQPPQQPKYPPPPPLSTDPAGAAASSDPVPADDGVLECPRGAPPRKRGDDGSVVYWRQWTEATPTWSSPHKPQAGEAPKYVTFEPDEGGFNNIRMALEIFVVFALATGRTLVIPDEYPMYLLGKKGHMHDFDDFYNMKELFPHLDVINMHEFLAREALPGHLKGGELPPGNATTFEKKRQLWEYVRRATDVFPVGPDGHVVAFGVPDNITTHDDLVAYRPEFAPFSVGRALLKYGPDLQAKKALHFTSMMDGGARYLAHFYDFLFFADRKVDLFMKRFVRDRLHYKAEIYCRAAKVVDMIRADVGGGADAYDAIHIRRGDFQFKNTRLEAEEIFANVEDIIAPGSLVYVLTDESNSTFFDPVRGRYRLRFLKDYWFEAEMDDMNPNLVGMVEQVIATGAREYVGTYFSTFTGYITRLRGYLGKNPGWYFLDEYKDILQPGKGSFYSKNTFYVQEWPVAYQGIDDE